MGGIVYTVPPVVPLDPVALAGRGNAMHNEHRPMIVTDGELMLAVIWHGGSIFRVHTYDTVPSNDRTLLGISLNEVDVFTVYGDNQGGPMSAQQAYNAAEQWLDEQRRETMALTCSNCGEDVEPVEPYRHTHSGDALCDEDIEAANG